MLNACADDLRAFDGARIGIVGGTGCIGSWLGESIRVANRDLGAKIRFVALDRHLIWGELPFDFLIHCAPVSVDVSLNHGVPVLYVGSGAALHKDLGYLDGSYVRMKRNDEAAISGSPVHKIARLYSIIAPNLPKHLAAAQFLTMARAGGPIVVHSGGTSIRTYLWAGDLVAWLWAIFARGKPAVVYEVGGSSEVSIGELARVLGDVAGCSVRFEGEPTAGDRYVPDVSRTVAEIGVRETIGLDEMLRLSL